MPINNDLASSQLGHNPHERKGGYTRRILSYRSKSHLVISLLYIFLLEKDEAHLDDDKLRWLWNAYEKSMENAECLVEDFVRCRDDKW